MRYRDTYEHWTKNVFFDEDTRCELLALTDEKEIEDRFYKDLEFGTGGLRGIMGAGTNRMNRYTVGRATKGLGEYLKKTYLERLADGVVIAYDTRNNSKTFAEAAAEVLTGMGIQVYMFDKPVPTPELSFAVKHLGCIAGIVITASHNPKEYNGYKVYDEYGCQLVPKQAKEVIKYVNSISDYASISFEGNGELKQYIDITDDFVDAVMEQSRSVSGKGNLRIIYTPLHGTGNIPVRQALKNDDFTDITVVPEQELPDGDFSTVKSPNPEERTALTLGLKLAEETDADIVLGTDPDCDRVGVGVKTADGYQLLTGNQIGALLMDFVLRHTDLKRYKRPAVVKTVVTSELGAEIAKNSGLTVFSTLTGFKFIGEKITQFESGNPEQAYDFIFGYEESYGYLAGTHARDKDAVVSSMLICEMAAECKNEGITLADRLEKIYEKYGYYRDALDSFTLKGKEGAERIAQMMSELRENGSPIDDTREIIDYSKPVKAEPGFGELPTSNVLKFIMNDGSWIAVRPSGTEPKIKLYYSIRGDDAGEAEQKFREYQTVFVNKMGL